MKGRKHNEPHTLFLRFQQLVDTVMHNGFRNHLKLVQFANETYIAHSSTSVHALLGTWIRKRVNNQDFFDRQTG